MGNLITQSNSQFGSPERAAFLKSVFSPQAAINRMKHMSCEVVFGSPSANCMGTGVCKISAATETPLLAQRERNCQRVPALLVPLHHGKGVSLIIAREMMCVRLLRTQFRGDKLKLTESCPIPADLTQAMSLKINSLQPGEYIIKEANGFFRINFYQG